MGVEPSSDLQPIAEGVWVASKSVRIVGTRLFSNMTVIRLRDGELLLHSPVPLTPTLRDAVNELGVVGHLYAPNTFHHLWLGDWADAYPEARVHAPAALTAKRPDLRVDRRHDQEPEPRFAGVLHEQHIAGFRLNESVLFHEASRSLVVADLVHNVGRPTDAWTSLYTRAMGFYDRVALSRVIRWAAFSDRAAARRSLDAVLEWPTAHLLVGHGRPVLDIGRDALGSAYTWLASGDG